MEQAKSMKYYVFI